MLSDYNIFATVAVKDLQAGKKFYGETLGLVKMDENPAGVMYKSGNGKLFVYMSPTAGSGEATCASWEVDDIEYAIEALKAKGIEFERYDFPGVTRQGDVHIFGKMKSAWFKDPDGNVLNLGCSS